MKKVRLSLLQRLSVAVALALVAACRLFSVASGGYSRVVVPGLLVAVAALVVEH